MCGGQVGEQEANRPGRRQTARRQVEASVSENTRRAYAEALRRLDGRELHDVTLAAYLAELHAAGRASASASMAVADALLPHEAGRAAHARRRPGRGPRMRPSSRGSSPGRTFTARSSPSSATRVVDGRRQID